jgi:glucosamine 6-phosphate synthetase-like amidotransferase/phosphosugar isomerase protein
MQKETFEQPSALANTLETVSTGHHVPPEILGAQAKDSLVGINQILILACGTSHHDGQVTRYWMEDLHSISTQVKIASEYRYRASDANHHQLVVTIYQSCENADTLAARRHLPYAIQKILALEPKIQAWAKHFADKTTASTWAWAGTTSSSWKAPSNSKKSSTSTPCLPRRRIHTQPPSPHRQANARHRRRPQ